MFKKRADLFQRAGPSSWQSAKQLEKARQLPGRSRTASWSSSWTAQNHYRIRRMQQAAKLLSCIDELLARSLLGGSLRQQPVAFGDGGDSRAIERWIEQALIALGHRPGPLVQRFSDSFDRCINKLPRATCNGSYTWDLLHSHLAM